MNSCNSHKATQSGFDEFDGKIREIFFEEGVVVPCSVEEVRRAKSLLEKRPVTVPPHLRDPSLILSRIHAENSSEAALRPDSAAKTLSDKAEFDKETGTASHEFVEAVLIAQLTRSLASSNFPLGRFRYNKFAYFSHRKVEDDVSTRYLKKAAGPYCPWAKYQGPEKIALKNGYVKMERVGSLYGLVVGTHIGKIDQYVSRYKVCQAVDWVASQFRYVKKDELELLATVDFAAVEVVRTGAAIDLRAIKHIIATNPEWAPKLDRSIFSDENIEHALQKLSSVFPATYYYK